MAGKSKSKVKETKSAVSEAAAFVLPDSLPCSEIDFPIVVKKKPKAKWKEILHESETRHKEIQAYADSKKEVVPKSPFLNTESDYIKNRVFVLLIPALEDTLNKAKIWEALVIQKCFFNGIDHIAQVAATFFESKVDFEVPKLFCRVHLGKYQAFASPRPYYPKSWLWPENYAATLIQKTVRQYFVQRDEEVHEMRDFWKKLEMEKENPNIDINPYLAKKFASEPNFNVNH